MQVGLTCGQFLQITPFTFSEHNLIILLSNQEENYKLFLNMKKNGTMYKELKLKKKKN